MVPSAFAKKRAAEGADFRRGVNPARGLAVELAEFLEFAVSGFGENFDAHRGGHVECAGGGFVGLAGFQRVAVVAAAHAALRRFGRAIAKNDFAGFFVEADDIRFAAGPLHFCERGDFFRIPLEPFLHAFPFQCGVKAGVPVKAGLQGG